MTRIFRHPAGPVAIVVATLFWLSMAAVAAVMLWRDREQTVEGALQNVAGMTQVIEAHTARTFQTVDLTLAGVADVLNLNPIPPHDARFRETLRARLVEMPHVRAIYVIGPDGHIIHDTDYPRTPDVSLADRPYFIAHRDNPALVRSISPPLESRSALGWFLATSRRVGREGKFEGVVVAAVQPNYFEGVYRRLDLAPGNAIALFHREGLMAARYPPQDGSIGTSFAGGRLFIKAAQQASGTYVAGPDERGKRRVVSYAMLEREPLLVAMYQELDTILDGWERRLRITLGVLGCLLLLVVLSTVMHFRRQALKSRQRQRQIQREKLEALGRLTGGTAHDFANLLGVVGNSLDLVARYAQDDTRILDAVAIGKRAVSSGANLIDQMLAFAKDRALRLETIDVNGLISSRSDLLRHAAGSGVTVSFKLADNLWRCRTDETQLEVALVNLVVNARDAMQSKGRIQISTSNQVDPEPPRREGEASPRLVCITVEDNGPGMSDEAREHLFEPFFTTKGEAGHGFGLPQIYGFMRQAGGDIRIDSAPGAGTRVDLAFPAAADPPRAA